MWLLVRVVCGALSHACSTRAEPRFVSQITSEEFRDFYLAYFTGKVDADKLAAIEVGAARKRFLDGAPSTSGRGGGRVCVLFVRLANHRIAWMQKGLRRLGYAS